MIQLTIVSCITTYDCTIDVEPFKVYYLRFDLINFQPTGGGKGGNLAGSDLSGNGLLLSFPLVSVCVVHHEVSKQ